GGGEGGGGRGRRGAGVRAGVLRALVEPDPGHVAVAVEPHPGAQLDRVRVGGVRRRRLHEVVPDRARAAGRPRRAGGERPAVRGRHLVADQVGGPHRRGVGGGGGQLRGRGGGGRGAGGVQRHRAA